MRAKFIIEGRMPSLNEYIRAINKHHMVGNIMKQTETDRAAWSAKAAKMPKFTRQVKIHFFWFEENRKRDLDNVAAAKKFIIDGLVRAQVIANDTQNYVKGFTDTFEYDPRNPRIEVVVEEV